MVSRAPKDIVIQYYDVLLRVSDQRLLNDNYWFNDTCIEFYFEYLERTLCEGDMTILFLRPDFVHLISHATDTRHFESALPPLMKEREVIFIPVNDNQSEGTGGSHWSLLVYHRPGNTFYYYDSLGDYNITSAIATAKKFEELLELNKTTFKPMKTPMQNNGSDCGVYVTSITELLSTRILKLRKDPDAVSDNDMLWDVTVPQNAVPLPSSMRRKMRTLVEELVNLAGGFGGRID